MFIGTVGTQAHVLHTIIMNFKYFSIVEAFDEKGFFKLAFVYKIID